MLEDLDGLLETISFAFGEVGTYLIEPESSAECVEQQNSGESAHTKQYSTARTPANPSRITGASRTDDPIKLEIASFVLCSALIMAEVIVGA